MTAGPDPSESEADGAALTASHLSKRYARDLRRSQRYGISAVLAELKPTPKEPADLRESEFWAVHDVSLHVRPGEAVGIVGRNGAGKSTLLRLLAGITKPSEGRVAVNGSLVALLDPNAGFDPVLSGRENVEVLYSLHDGRRPTPETIARIAAYAGVDSVIDAPVRTYSQGMRLRLGFSAVIHIEPDILLIDEALAVGDTAFQIQCLEQLHAFRRSGGALLFVSHSLWLFQHLATRGIHIDAGSIVVEGAPADVADHYLAELQKGSWVDAGGGPDLVEREQMGRLVAGPEDDTDDDAETVEAHPQRPVSFARVRATGPDGGSLHSGSPATLQFELQAHEPVASAEMAMTVWTADLSVCVVGDVTRTVRHGRPDGSFELPMGRSRLSYQLGDLPLTPGRYALRAAVFDATTSDVLALHGFEDSPTWLEVTGEADVPAGPGLTSTPRMRPLRTIDADWSC